MFGQTTSVIIIIIFPSRQILFIDTKDKTFWVGESRQVFILLLFTSRATE